MTSPAPQQASFVVPLRDLEDGPKSLDAEITSGWLSSALQDTEAVPAGTPGRITVTLSKNGAEVLVRGKVTAPVIVPCARTLAPIRLELKADLLLLLRRAKAAPSPRPSPQHGEARVPKEGSAGSERSKRQRHGGESNLRPVGRTSRVHHKKPENRRSRGGWPEDPELSVHDAAQDTFEGERIVLDPFLREFILLELPMFPVRQDLPSLPVEARASRPGSQEEPTPAGQGSAQQPPAAAAPIDPRLAPLAELKDRLQKKKQQE